MNEQEIRQLKSKAQRLETILNSFQKDVELLYEAEVDVGADADIASRQQEAQDEMEQIASDILLLLDKSGEIETEDGATIDLPNPQRNPVSEGDLPEPSGKRPEGRGDPQWSKGSKKKNDKKNNGRGN